MTQTLEDDFNERLIDCVRTFPVLWEMKRNSYKDKVAKENAWKNIPEILKHSEEDCKKRWRNIRDAYKRNRKRAITGSAAIKSKYTDNDHLKFLDASLAERESQCTIEENYELQYTTEENEGDESTQSIRIAEDKADSSSDVEQIGGSKVVIANNEMLTNVLQETSTDRVLKPKHIHNECSTSTSTESIINPLEKGALNANLSGRNIRKRTHFAPYNNQIWNEMSKNQTERFEVIKTLLKNTNDTNSSKVWQKQSYSFHRI